MNVVRALLLGSWSLLAACGGDGALLQDAGGGYRLVAQYDGAEGIHEARERLHPNGAQALLFTHQERLARVAAASSSAFHIVTIGDSAPDEMFPATASSPPRAEQTAVVLDETGAAVAVDLALLWCHGITPPRRLALGTRILMPGGAVITQPAPGDFVVTLLRREHAALLTDKPQTDVVFRIGLVMQRADDRHLQVRNQADVAAKRYPHLTFVDRTAEGDPARLEAIVREFLGEGHRAILVSTDDPKALGPIATAAREHSAALFVLDPAADCDHATCCIGCDQHTLGRAAGEAVKLLLPNGAAIVELADDLQDESVQLRHRGFRDALGLLPR